MENPDTQLHRKRCHRENLPGDAHFLTFSCFDRRPYLSRDRARKWLTDAIARALELHHFDLWAYVIMPEHVHLIVFPRQDSYVISSLLNSIKQPVAKKAANFVRREAPQFVTRMQDHQPNGQSKLRFWQRGGGYDRNIYSTDELWEKIDYIHNNPVKRGLVTSAIEYQWSSAADYEGMRRGPLPVIRSFCRAESFQACPRVREHGTQDQS